MAACVIIGGGIALIRWFYHRGERENAVVSALEANTSATNENAKATLEVATELRDFKVIVVEKMHDLDIRLTRAESKIEVKEQS
jgi:hypothetical protein